MPTYCKRCGSMVEADLTIDGYGVRCGCAGEEYRSALQTIKRLMNYARHADDCRHHNTETMQCDCGYMPVLVLMKEMEDK